MPSLTFYPLGNADCCLIRLANDKRILFDYANKRCADDDDDKRIDLPVELRKDLGKRVYYDSVVFTHLDDDHICGASEFFHLDHAKKYQGEGRIKMSEMWVPAAAITEESCEDEARIIQAEARYRLKQKKGISVFSRPNRLKDWLKDNGLTVDDVKHLLVDAGKLVPTFTLAADGVEFFVHSPFATRMNDAEVEDRNQDSIVVQAVFEVDGTQTKAMLGSDSTHECWTDMVNITKYHKREERLEWDIMKLPHHCSYLSIGPERSTKKSPNKTVPVKEVKYLYEEKGLEHCRIISTSKPIPVKGSEEDECGQPPHREAANYYKEDVLKTELADRWLVTMEHPNEASPKPIVIKVDKYKATLEKIFAGGVAAIVTHSAPRAG